MKWSKWNPFKPFGREASEVQEILQAVVENRLDCREWDAFLRIPMLGTPELDKIRIACEALESEERTEDDGIVRHTEQARKKIETLLAEIKNEPNK